MGLLLPRRYSSKLKLLLVVSLIFLSLHSIRVAAEWGAHLGGYVFEALRAYRVMAPDTRTIFEATAGIASLAVTCAVIGWLWYRLIRVWRRVKARIDERLTPAPF